MALQPLSQIVTWANRLLDGFLCFPMLTDCCGQSVGAALNLKESNQGMIYSLLLEVKKTQNTLEHQAKWSGNRQKKWFFFKQHPVKLELAAMGCCRGQNKEWVKDIWAHLGKKSPLKAVKHKDANRASGSWNQAVCCQNPWGCTLKSISGCLSCCCILSLSVHYQLSSETAYWARGALRLAERAIFSSLWAHPQFS